MSNISEITAVDVVGLDNESHGRSCTQHLCCGHTVKVDDVLFCSWQIVVIEEGEDAIPEEVIQVYKVAEDGLAYCHVGFLAKRLFKKYGPKAFDKMFLLVKKDYRVSDNSHERSRSHHYNGMALASIIVDDNRFNGKNPLEGEPCIMASKKRKQQKSLGGEEGTEVDDDDDDNEDFNNTPKVAKARNRRKPITYL
jgi:hypothetical protein